MRPLELLPGADLAAAAEARGVVDVDVEYSTANPVARYQVRSRRPTRRTFRSPIGVEDVTAHRVVVGDDLRRGGVTAARHRDQLVVQALEGESAPLTPLAWFRGLVGYRFGSSSRFLGGRYLAYALLKRILSGEAVVVSVKGMS
jgi:hypothetical protein